MRCPLHPTPRRVLTCSSPLHSPLYCLTLAHHLPLFTHSLLSHALSPSHCPQHHRPLHRHTASLTLPLSCILPMLSSISMAHTLNYYYSLHSIYLTLSLSLSLSLSVRVCVCVCVCVWLARCLLLCLRHCYYDMHQAGIHYYQQPRTQCPPPHSLCLSFYTATTPIHVAPPSTWSALSLLPMEELVLAPGLNATCLLNWQCPYTLSALVMVSECPLLQSFLGGCPFNGFSHAEARRQLSCNLGRQCAWCLR